MKKGKQFVATLVDNRPIWHVSEVLYVDHYVRADNESDAADYVLNNTLKYGNDGSEVINDVEVADLEYMNRDEMTIHVVPHREISTEALTTHEEAL